MKHSFELISTGTELLNGRSLNSHGQTLAQHLEPLGLVLTRDTTIRDDKQALIDVLGEALRRCDLVFVTGGLGPTVDDVTRDAVAVFVGSDIRMDEDAVEQIRLKCEERRLEFNEARKRQALVVSCATALPNAAGAAPGEWIEHEGRLIILLPGPPGELLCVLEEQVIPRLKQRFGLSEEPAERVFLTCGVAEADLMTLFEQNNFPPEGVEIAYCAAPGRVEIRLGSPGGETAVLEVAAEALESLLGEKIFARERMEMEEVVGALLEAEGATVATAESCTGGLVGHRLTSVSGSSNYFLGGVIAYANDVKIRILGVDPDVLGREGAVSAHVAEQMARGVREKLGADYGIGITGIAGPTGGTPEKPVGLVYIAVAGPDEVRVREHHFGGGRERIKQWSSQMALNTLRLMLQQVE